MNQRTSDTARSKADEDQAERDIEEFARLSGQGNSAGWTFNREEIHQRDQVAGPQRLKPD